jgi:hypothetical protein
VGKEPWRGAERDAERRAPLPAPVELRGFAVVRDFRGEEEAVLPLRVRADEPPVLFPFAGEELRPLREAPRCDEEWDGMAWWSCVKARDLSQVPAALERRSGTPLVSRRP